MRFLMPHTVKSRVQPGCEHASLQRPLRRDELEAIGHRSQISRACRKSRETANSEYPKHPAVTLA